MKLPLDISGLVRPQPPHSPQFIDLYNQDGQNARAGPLDGNAELIAGLHATPACVSPKYFYNALGSKLFEAITGLDEYYPTRTEGLIFDAANSQITAALLDAGIQQPCLIDLGAGNCAKALALMPHVQRWACRRRSRQWWVFPLPAGPCRSVSDMEPLYRCRPSQPRSSILWAFPEVLLGGLSSLGDTMKFVFPRITLALALVDVMSLAAGGPAIVVGYSVPGDFHSRAITDPEEPGTVIVDITAAHDLAGHDLAGHEWSGIATGPGGNRELIPRLFKVRRLLQELDRPRPTNPLGSF